MNIENLRAKAIQLFPLAVRCAVENPGLKNVTLDELEELCWNQFEPLGFSCMADCFAAVVPKTEGELTLTAWSAATIKIGPWTFTIRCRPLHLSPYAAHLEIKHQGPLPGVTETCYLSLFIPLATFADTTPEEFIRSRFSDLLPREFQGSLF